VTIETTTYYGSEFIAACLHLHQPSLGDLSKKQVTIETATYGSELIAACLHLHQPSLGDLCTTLHYLGLPIETRVTTMVTKSSVVDSSTIPHSKLHKHQNMLSFHHACEVITAKIAAVMPVPCDMAHG
jgi:hypothetical protein